ncbi:MAG TPA: DUF4010 domain-containing protein [Ideonella sp.]|nr:DUF4010 domain-containing protein [Ideonella sp.]
MDKLPTDIPADVSGLAAALVVGLLIGLQRGWSARDQAEGSRVAGLRTYALIGLMGGVLASLPAELAAWALAAGLLGLGVLMAVSYRESVRSDGDLSATSAVAALLTAALGAFAAGGHAVTALAAAVVAAVLLDYKSTLHRWLQRVEQAELRAALQVLVLSVVVLPLLPDRGFGPHEALNPYRLWWAVVLLAGLSLAGHVAMRLSGPQRGLLWTGLLGGLASSTATTLALARHARREPALLAPSAAGALAACGVMFLRMLVVVAVLQPPLVRVVAAPLVASGAVLLTAAAWQWRHRGRAPRKGDEAQEMAPFDLGTVLGFGALLAVVGWLTEAGKVWFGATGVYGVAALSGLVDVDAIVVSLARLQGGDPADTSVPLLGMALAALTNMLSKSAIAWVAGGAAFGKRIAGGCLASALVGAAVVAATQ